MSNADTQARDDRGRFVSAVAAEQVSEPTATPPADADPVPPPPESAVDAEEAKLIIGESLANFREEGPGDSSEPISSPEAFTGSLTVTPDPNLAPAAVPQVIPPNPGQDPRYAQMSIRTNWTPAEKQWTEERQAKGWGHVRPYSCYLGAIGNHWKPKSWAHVIDMVQYANEHGAFVVLDEIQDRCHEPYDALGVMRNEVIQRAEYGGYEYVCMVDNDILPKEDTLFRMMRAMWLENITACAPIVVEPGTGRPLHGPTAEPYSGRKSVRWNVLSMLVFKTAIFRSFPPASFWHDPRGADEGFHYQKLYSAGHHPMIDTEILLPIQQAPTYPLTIEKQENRDAMWGARKQAFAEIPDRRPHRPDDPRVNEHGIYLPFLPVRCIPERGGCGNMVGGKWWEDSQVCPTCQQRQGQASGLVLEAVDDSKPDGFYRRCKAIENGKQCPNQHPNAHGYCANHLDRIGVA